MFKIQDDVYAKTTEVRSTDIRKAMHESAIALNEIKEAMRNAVKSVLTEVKIAASQGHKPQDHK
jgi:hypothetical protein